MTSLLQLLHDQTGNAASLETFVIGLILAFLLGQLTAWTYMYTHTGISYSRSFVQSIVLLTVIVALSMAVIGNNIAMAFGLLGALSMIRFRNVLKDTRDTAFIFFAVVIGIACGTGRYALALAGALLFCPLTFYLHLTTFGVRRPGDAFLRFHVLAAVWRPDDMRALLRRHCFSVCMVTQSMDGNSQMECAFQLTMRDPDRAHLLVEELGQVNGISSISFLFQAEEGEV